MSTITLPTEGLKEKFEGAYEKFREDVKRPNILLLGQTGVGKSSLINTIFGKNLAQISDVKPETKGFHEYSDPNIDVNIIDSEGYELGETEKFKSSLTEYINSNFSTSDRQVHITWYCISISGDRVLPYDLDNLQYILNERKIPVCVVFTQCDLDDPEGTKFKILSKVVTNRFGNKIPCFQTSSDESLKSELDLDKLVRWSLDNLSDENLKLGFIMSQKIELSLKDEKVKSRIAWYAAGASVIGASPIPFSDAIALTTLQATMASDIFSIYGINNTISSILRNIIGGRVVSYLGKFLAGTILKFIPGVGSLAGGIINATVAATITRALGYALSKLARKTAEGVLDGNFTGLENIFTEENINALVEENLKNKNQNND
jgi:uncharacterized protein (DUF697 family)/GTP-binding protein EngB required for normal cell division